MGHITSLGFEDCNRRQTHRRILTANYLPPCNIMATSQTDDVRIKQIRPLIPPALLLEDFPLSGAAQDTVLAGRKGAEAIVRGDDDRLLVVVGPCSIHDVKAALEYSKLLKEYIDQSKDDLHIIMRVYFEKPRTTVGWKGLINDPQLNGSFAINKGLRLARGLLLELAENGLLPESNSSTPSRPSTSPTSSHGARLGHARQSHRFTESSQVVSRPRSDSRMAQTEA